MTNEQLIEIFCTLSMDEKERLINKFIDEWEAESTDLNTIMHELEGIKIKSPACVHCNSEDTYKRGRIKGIQRYSCKLCKKYWMSTHGTSLAGLHKRNLWKTYIRVFESGYSIRKAAKEVGICIQTSFRWRHRLLASISCFLPKMVSGISECNDIQMPKSYKGQRRVQQTFPKGKTPSLTENREMISILTSVSRNKQTAISNVIGASKVKAEHIQQIFRDNVEPGSILITRSSNCYKSLDQLDTIKHISIEPSKRPGKKNLIHVEFVQKNQLSFKTFLLPFRGVATKYLQNYLNWHHYRDTTKSRIDKLRQALIVSLISDKAFEWMKKINNNDTIIIT